MIYYLIPIQTNDFYSSPESNLFIILAHFDYVKVLTETAFLTKISNQTIVKDSTIFITDNQLNLYHKIRNKIKSIYILAVQKKQTELDLIGLQQAIQNNQLIFQSKLQQKSYQNWYTMEKLDPNWMELVKILPIYSLNWNKKWKVHQTLYPQNEINATTNTMIKRNLIVFDSANPLSIHLTSEFEKIGYHCLKLTQVKSVSDLRETIDHCYMFIQTGKLTDFPYLLLMFLEEGIPFLTINYLYSLIDSSYSVESLINSEKSGGLTITRELYPDIKQQFDQISQDYRKFHQNAKLSANQINTRYQLIYEQLFPNPIHTSKKKITPDGEDIISSKKKIGLKLGGNNSPLTPLEWSLSSPPIKVVPKPVSP